MSSVGRYDECTFCGLSFDNPADLTKDSQLFPVVVMGERMHRCCAERFNEEFYSFDSRLECANDSEECEK